MEINKATFMHHAKMPAGHLVNQRKRWSSEINVTELIEISSSEVFFFIKIIIVLDFTGVWFKLRLAGHLR